MGTRNQLAGELSVGEMARKTSSPASRMRKSMKLCRPLANNHVRRLPVVNDKSIPQGILSMDDILTHGDLNKWLGCCEISSEEIIQSLRRLYGQKYP
jgi:signal-transduction protein with cAMP-binding, CBS, and nucleotidyltransferase domain